MELYDFDKCEYSIRDGFYGGMAGDKAGIDRQTTSKDKGIAISMLLKFLVWM